MRTIWLLLSFTTIVGCVSTKELEEKIADSQKQNNNFQGQIRMHIEILDDLQKEKPLLKARIRHYKPASPCYKMRKPPYKKNVIDESRKRR
jgi:hypothetical protein